jgi:hypothetical protein
LTSEAEEGDASHRHLQRQIELVERHRLNLVANGDDDCSKCTDEREIEMEAKEREGERERSECALVLGLKQQ